MKSINVFLDVIKDTDVQNLLDILTDNRVNRTYMLPDFACREDALPLFRKLSALSADPSRYVRGIKIGDALIGFINDVERDGDSIELGYVIHPSYHGKGYMTQALRAAIAELFAIGYRQVVAGAFEENRASIRVMEKAGMTPLEKTEEIEYRGAVHNCIYYHIVCCEHVSAK